MLVRPELGTAINNITDMMHMLDNGDIHAQHDASRAKRLYCREWEMITAFWSGRGQFIPGARTSIWMWALHAAMVRDTAKYDKRIHSYLG